MCQEVEYDSSTGSHDRAPLEDTPAEYKTMNKQILCGASLLAAGVAQAQMFHLGIDITDPSAVVITATPLNATANSSLTLFDGVTLQLFFTGEVPSTTFAGASGNLAPFASGVAYDTWAVDDTIPSIFSDLSFYRSSDDPPSSPPQIFGTFFTAFSGTATLNLASQASLLPILGTSGPIFAGYSDNLGPVIGTWQVTAVPELPVAAHLALYGAGFAGLWTFRRFRKS